MSRYSWFTIYRTNEEKQKLIEEFKASGLSMNKWCQANGIATSTMSTWLGPKRKNKIKQIKKAKFIEVPKANIKNNNKDKSIVIEYKDFKISIADSFDTIILADVLKVVASINV